MENIFQFFYDLFIKIWLNIDNIITPLLDAIEKIYGIIEPILSKILNMFIAILDNFINIITTILSIFGVRI